MDGLTLPAASEQLLLHCPANMHQSLRSASAAGLLLCDLQFCSVVFNDFMTRINDHENHRTPPGVWRWKMDMMNCQASPHSFPLSQWSSHKHAFVTQFTIHFIHTHTVVKPELHSSESCSSTHNKNNPQRRSGAKVKIIK